MTGVDDTARTADVVIIGGGIVGMSIAYQLTRRSDIRVIVIEKAPTVAEGSTGASSAVIRMRYTHAEVIRLAATGLEIYRNWAEYTGLDAPRAGFARTGVLWMLGEDCETVQAEANRLGAAGASASVLGWDDVGVRYSELSPCAVPFDPASPEHDCRPAETFLFEEEGGYCTDPAGANHDLTEAARRDGVSVRLGTRVAGIRSASGHVVGVDLADGTSVDAPTVVNAAGPWCNEVNRLADVDLGWPIRPTRIQVMYRVAAEEWVAGLPIVGDGAGGIYFRPDSRGQQLLVGSIRSEDERERVDDPDDFRRSIDDDSRQRMIDALHHRLPSLEHRGRITGVAGLYTINTEDVHPVVGPTELDGYIVANGFSGHGFKLAPAVGALVARSISGADAPLDPDVPLDFFGVDRDSLTVREKNVLA